MNSTLGRWLFGIRDLPADAENIRLAWERPFEGWLWVLVVVGAFGIALWSYSRLDAGGRARGLLGSIRALILVLLAVCIAGPMAELPRELVEPDWVAVLVDRSRSMQVRDGSTTVVDRRTREEDLQSILDAAGPAWWNPGDARRVMWLGFGDGVFDLEGSPSAEESPTGSPVITADPDGWGTKIAPAIEEVLRRTAGKPLAGIVLVSDGRTDAPPDRDLVRRMIGSAAGVHAVALGAEIPMGDAGITKIDAPRRAFARDAVPVGVRIGNRGRDGTVTVSLVDLDDDEVLDSTEIELRSDRSIADTVLTATPRRTDRGSGTRRWEVRIEGEDDLVRENDVVQLDVDFVDRPLRVLYIEGYPRWEYRYLKNLLVREPSIESSV
ncbi:MAG: VWA domain-containing protein, partial [Phycisphaeraceae bacterium]|nr:VWA domain-containing protein [Phycisphaeraceae bacterium]